MMVGGIGSVPEDLGVEREQDDVRAARRDDLACHRGDGGARRLRHHQRPVLAGQAAAHQSPGGAQPAARRAQLAVVRQPHVRRDSAHPDPDLGNGLIPVPSPITVFTLDDEFDRGYIRSFNVAVQKELRWGFVGEAAYVGTRQIDQLGFRELNWSPIGGGQAGRQLNKKFGRTGQTRLIAPVGDSSVRRAAGPSAAAVRQRLPVRRELHLVEVHGRAARQRQRAADQHPRVLRPEQVAQQLRPDAQPGHHQHHGAAVRAGPPVAQRRRAPVADRRWLAGEQHPQLLQRPAVQRHGVGHVAERAGERTARRPGRRRSPRFLEASARQTRTSIRWRSSPSPRPASARQGSTACAGPAWRRGT